MIGAGGELSSPPESRRNRTLVTDQTRCNFEEHHRTTARVSAGLALTANAKECLRQCIRNMRKLHDCAGDVTGCNCACVSCLKSMAYKMKLHRAHNMLAAQQASLRALCESAESMLLSHPENDTVSRGILLADSVVGKCVYEGPEYELACCIIDLASTWGMAQQMTELWKMGSQTGGATKWCRWNDWGISAKPPNIYAERFIRSISDYFNVGMELRNTRADSLLGYDSLIEDFTTTPSASSSEVNLLGTSPDTEPMRPRLSTDTMEQMFLQEASFRNNFAWPEQGNSFLNSSNGSSDTKISSSVNSDSSLAQQLGMPSLEMRQSGPGTPAETGLVHRHPHDVTRARQYLDYGHGTKHTSTW